MQRSQGFEFTAKECDMPAIINTNIASLNAQRNTAMSQASLQISTQRLSSGLRVNSAKDENKEGKKVIKRGEQPRGN